MDGTCRASLEGQIDLISSGPRLPSRTSQKQMHAGESMAPTHGAFFRFGFVRLQISVQPVLINMA